MSDIKLDVCDIKLDVSKMMLTLKLVSGILSCLAPHNGAASMRCLDCGVDIYYCEPCCRDVHSIRHKYHTPEYWTGCRFIPSPFLNISVGMEHSGCQSNFVEKLTIIGINREFRTVVRNPA